MSLRPDLVLLHFGDSSRFGLEDADYIREVSTEFKILMIGVPDNEVDTLGCLEHGASGYLPDDVSTETLITSARAVAAGEHICSPGSWASPCHGSPHLLVNSESRITR
jgi:DNA-binding NarL/FixJ family response regulator